MKTFTRLLEKNDDTVWTVKIDLTIQFNSANEGEAAFLVEKLLSELPVKKNYTITDVKKGEDV